MEQNAGRSREGPSGKVRAIGEVYDTSPLCHTSTNPAGTNLHVTSRSVCHAHTGMEIGGKLDAARACRAAHLAPWLNPACQGLLSAFSFGARAKP